MNKDKLFKAMKKKVAVLKFDLKTLLHDKQYEFVTDKSRYKIAVSGRKAGKTRGIIYYLLHESITKPFSKNLYLAETRPQAKKLIWYEMVRLNAQYELNGDFNEHEQIIRFPNGSSIEVNGCKDRTEIEKFRGPGYNLMIIDEAGSFGLYLNDLINEVLDYETMETKGTLVLIGTPPPVRAGLFFEAYHGLSTGRGFKPFHWTLLENPFISDPNGEIEARCQRRGVTRDDPSIRRELFAEFIEDESALVFKFNRQKNTFTELPQGINDWKYIIGVDLGYEDATAIVVLAFSYTHSSVYLVDEFVSPKKDVTDISNYIKNFQEEYKPIKMMVDAGALGKMIVMELKNRHQLNLTAAEKQHKNEFIELMNADLRRSLLKFQPTSKACEDMVKLEWDKTNPHKWKVDERFHSDIMDAILYAWRECRHYLAKEQQMKPQPNSPQYHQEQLEKRIEEKLKTSRRKDKEMKMLNKYGIHYLNGDHKI